MDNGRRSLDGGSVTATETLAQMIARRKRGRSFAKLSADCGGVPSDKRLQQMSKGDLKNFPDPQSVLGLAKGLPASVTDVVLASARELGLPVMDGLTPEGVVIPGVSDLPETSIAVLEAVARELNRLVESTEGDHHAETPQQGPQARGEEQQEPPSIGAVTELRRPVRPAPKPSAGAVPKAADTPRKGKRGEAFDPETGEYEGGEE